MGAEQSKGSTGESDYPIEHEHTCDEINKRSIGKFIIKCCGHEGIVDEQDNRLRPLLQGAITHLDKEKEHVWKNAELTFYDKYANCFIMKAGEGQNKFLVHLDGKDEIEVICTEREPSRVGKFFSESWLNPYKWVPRSQDPALPPNDNKSSASSKSATNKEGTNV
ncbi:uncharacterized protein LOC100370711 [Saccoglossus kowalevskii]|uniref:Uncharacterized protein LOC100370711 n=1 Tax=Saccoglossus kowalevskii TaxID=10224 RepID=A0ABM0GRF1_SACKO|nr:PREDICTED: uncharacterized protein LOC100370711 [Saccoglossus kowalevskii]